MGGGGGVSRASVADRLLSSSWLERLEASPMLLAPGESMGGRVGSGVEREALLPFILVIFLCRVVL